MTTKQTDQNTVAIPAQYYINDTEQQDEIDLFELVASILKQWKLILVISFVGTLLGVVYAYNLPRQYENFAQIRSPLPNDLKIIQLNGYGVDINALFSRLYDNLKSPEVFKQYLIESDTIKQFYPELKNKEDIDRSVIGLTTDLDVNFLDNEHKKTKGGGKSRILRIKLKSPNEKIAINVINNYLINSEKIVLTQIMDRGKYVIKLRKQAIEEEIEKLRTLAKQTRLNSIADLKETLNVAQIMGVTNTMMALPTNNAKSKTLNLFLNQVNQFQKYMMGSDYLTAEISRLESRGAEITADDAFIAKMPALLSELSILNKKSFDFEGAKLYTLDKLAAERDAPTKPNKKLIAIISMLLSGFFALFVALIVSTIQKRKLAESRINSES